MCGWEGQDGGYGETALNGLAEGLSDKSVAYVLMCKGNRPGGSAEGGYAGGVR